MSYRPRASALHVAGAGAALTWFGALGAALLLEGNPLVLAALMVTIGAAAWLARVGRELRRALPYAVGLGVSVCVINALVSRAGLTVVWRFGDLPILGQTDVTLEALAAGAVLGLRAAGLILLGGLYTLTVDPDAVLRLLRRSSFRSALTATIATRMLPILVRDSRGLAEAQRCRAGRPPGRIALLQATTSNVLDRALDVAATLEVRGYSGACRVRRRRASWSRHDLAFVAASVGILSVALASLVLGLAPFSAYPGLQMHPRAGDLMTCAALALIALAPFLDRRGIEL